MDPEKFPRGDIRERSVFGVVGGGGPNAVFGNFNVNKRNFSTPGGPTPSPPITDPRFEGMKICSMADHISPRIYWKYACFGVG